MAAGGGMSCLNKGIHDIRRMIHGFVAFVVFIGS